MLVPLYGFVQGDTLGLLVLAHAEWSIHEVTRALAQSARLRVGEIREASLFFEERVLDPKLTVSSAGLLPLSRIELRPLRKASALNHLEPSP